MNLSNNWRPVTCRIMSGFSSMQGKDAPSEKTKWQLRRLYDAGVQAVLPSTIIGNSIRVTGNDLEIRNKRYSLNNNVYLVGFGKAVMGMAGVLEEKLQSRLKRGIVSVPRGSNDKFGETRDNTSGVPVFGRMVEYRENSSNNQPDSDTLQITREIVDLVGRMEKDDTLIVLISGGGSALLCMPKPTIQSDVKLNLCKKLQNSGANIKELNIVRKNLSMVKGGRLARMAYPGRVISLILSDIVGDPMDLIASGPTVHSEKTSAEALSILKKYNLYESVVEDLKILLNSDESVDDDCLLNAENQFKHVDNIIIGNNSLAIEAASHEALRIGLSPILLRNDVVGRVEEVSEAYARITNLICQVWNKSIDEKTFAQSMVNDSVIGSTSEEVNKILDAVGDASREGIVLIGAGEPTVMVRGSGKGGRNQELALRFSLDWFVRVRDDSRLDQFEVTFLSAGTDGQDGPTDASGAFGYPAIEPTMQALVKRLETLFHEKNIAEKSKKDSPSGQDENYPRKDLGLQENMNEDLRFDQGASSYRSMLRQARKLLPQTVLMNNDTYNFYSRLRKGKDMVKTGISGTNVMDLHFVLIRKGHSGCRLDINSAEKDPHLVDDHDLHTDIDEASLKFN